MISPKRLFLAAGLVAVLAAPAVAEDVAYELNNNSALTILEFYTSPASMDTWGPDVLGSGVIAPGEARVVNIMDGSDQCSYDLRFVMEDGQELIANAVDICTLASYTLE
jgi:hypothetical protein